MKYTTLMAVVVSGLVVNVDDLESPKCGMVECDAEGSAFFNLLDVLSGGWIEVFEECFADEDGYPRIVPVAMAPEYDKVLGSDPCRLVAFRGVSFLETNDVGLSRQRKQLPVFNVLSNQVVGEETLCIP